MVSEEKILKMLTDGRTDDGRTDDGRTTDAEVTGILIAHLGAFGSGELKKLLAWEELKVNRNHTSSYFQLTEKVLKS